MTALAGRSVLCTGATGSFGHAFVKRALAAGVRRLVVYSRDELKQAQMVRLFPDDRLRCFIGDVRDADRLRLAMQGIEVCVHAAALKRIETCENEPSEAIATNILGTQNVARAAAEAGVERALFLSTDKSAQPETLYGFTKGTAERAWARWNVYSAGHRTRYACTRYGNVLASRGSVVELWRRQKAANEPLTLTSETASRFWMTMADAVTLVTTALHQMRGGEIFVPRIGSSTVLDLARAIAGPGLYAPGHTVTGLLPAEKEHETLITPDEGRHTYDGGAHLVIEPENRSWGPQPPSDLPRVPEGFTYRSDTNPQQLTLDDLRRMLL